MIKSSKNMVFLTICFLILTVFSQTSSAQSTTEGDPNNTKDIKVMILGTFHFHHAPDYYDIKSPKHQNELNKVLDSLKEFRPTKIALEESYKGSKRLDSLYIQFRSGKLDTLHRGERQQLGFRLANRLGHDTLYAVDYKLSWPYGEVMSWAKKNDPEFITFYKRWKQNLNAYEDSLYRNATLTEFLKWLNSKSYRDRLKNVRMRRLELGAGTNFIGSKTISSSYERNLRIFANITKYAQPGDRILVIFGASHSYFLREFVQMHPDYSLVEANDYL